MTKRPDLWSKERVAVKATQIAFDLAMETQFAIKQAALSGHLNSTDYIRKILGLDYNKCPVRPRLTVTLKPEDIETLAHRFGVDPTDTVAIREQVAAVLIEHARAIEDGMRLK